MMTTISDFQIQGRLVDWTPLLEEWLLATQRFYRLVAHGGAAYKYNERGHVSILAGAAWRCGWGAISEFKRRTPTMPQAGRADLWLHTGTTQFLCEAKFDWDGPFLGKTTRLLQAACDDAIKKYLPAADETPCGIAFLCPCFPRSNGGALLQGIEDVICSVRALQVDACAWSFPECERFAQGEHNDYLPGIVLIARVPTMPGVPVVRHVSG